VGSKPYCLMYCCFFLSSSCASCSFVLLLEAFGCDGFVFDTAAIAVELFVVVGAIPATALLLSVWVDPAGLRSKYLEGRKIVFSGVPDGGVPPTGDEAFFPSSFGGVSSFCCCTFCGCCTFCWRTSPLPPILSPRRSSLRGSTFLALAGKCLS